MLYFRFDFSKEDFKGTEHKSILYGYEAEDRAIQYFEDENVSGYYLKEYNELKRKFWDDEEITEEEYDEKFDALVKEFIADEWTLNGCSCFELTEEGIENSIEYGYDNRPLITVFEGTKVDSGHDGEEVAKCEKILFQGNANEITSIFYDDIENKVEEVSKKIGG